MFFCVTIFFIHGVLNPLLCCEVFIFITFLHYSTPLIHRHQCGLSPLPPGIILSNMRTLSIKIVELQPLVGGKQRLLFSSVLCFTETWLCEPVPDSELQLPGLQLFRADWVTEWTTSWSCQAKQKVNASVFPSTIADVLMWQWSFNTVLWPGILRHKL